ncbi:MAG: FAD-dependent oxidoreductase [Geminicoccaceae bacterium]|nr:FAD-binding oxidoreductase [Geminicoccaceae bacterium]MCS7268047.1 FAD-binding oxidoreductase [Geminicoccaceae bacterium]MDW8124758.1 FAD-dependent oxidoreductase [Geminicoccaceae bacterium]MDW8341425.1 FAD-dependent oxidoreductase [Geminicoccaceae bacterium]
MIPDEIEPLARSLWAATAPPEPELETLDGEEETEAAIVGGGYTGLSAALHLAERGIACALLEARGPGWGASGRNGGQVIAGLKEDPDTVERILGPSAGKRAVALSARAPDLVFDLVGRYGIACDAVRSGWIQPAADPASARLQRARLEQWQRRGAPVEWLDRKATAQALGTELYASALLDHRGGTLNPLAYARGLARAALSKGARIFARSRAIAVERDGAGWRVRTRRGALRARFLLLCTNAYTDGLHREMARSLLPVVSVQVASAPLSANLRASILPEGRAASDTRRLLVYFRLDPQGRLVIGGRGAYSARGIRAAQARLRRLAKRMFPQLPDDLPFEFAWGGLVALTEDRLPFLVEPEPGLLLAGGYNGRGVAMATAMGKVLADKVAGVPDAELDFPLRKRLRPMPLYGLRKPLVSLAVAIEELQDRAGL